MRALASCTSTPAAWLATCCTWTERSTTARTCPAWTQVPASTSTLRTRPPSPAMPTGISRLAAITPLATTVASTVCCPAPPRSRSAPAPRHRACRPRAVAVHQPPGQRQQHDQPHADGQPRRRLPPVAGASARLLMSCVLSSRIASPARTAHATPQWHAAWATIPMPAPCLRAGRGLSRAMCSQRRFEPDGGAPASYPHGWAQACASSQQRRSPAGPPPSPDRARRAPSCEGSLPPSI
jgi:hypothetical protein